jgi:hypothetical protein
MPGRCPAFLFAGVRTEYQKNITQTMHANLFFYITILFLAQSKALSFEKIPITFTGLHYYAGLYSNSPV